MAERARVQMTKKLTVEFVPCEESLDEVISNALMTQLMITIVNIGKREIESNCSIIKKEKEHDKDSQK